MMRLNQFLAAATSLSRRSADVATTQGRVAVNGSLAQLGQMVDPASDKVALDGQLLQLAPAITVAYHKPVGVVTSRQGQGSETIYDQLPAKLANLKAAGRLDKDSSGLLILTSDGSLANRITHPSGGKTKTYRVKLNRPLAAADISRLKQGIELDEGLSRLDITDNRGPELTLTMVTGWNRQIRRTFQVLGYQVLSLERTAIGQLELGNLNLGAWRPLKPEETAWFK